MSTELTREERKARIDELCAEYRETENSEVLHKLWPLVEKLAYRIINQVIRKIGTDNLANIGVSSDDLKQCGYLALPSTAKYYDPDKGTFGTVFTYSLKTQ